MTEEIEELRQEIAALKKDMRHILKLLNQEKFEDETDYPDEIVFEGSKFAARAKSRHIPFIIHAMDDGVDVVLSDKEMRVRALLSIGEDSACLEFRNAKGNLIAQLSEAPDGGGQFCVCDADGNPRAGMRVNEYGGVVNVLDVAGRPQVVLIGAETGGELFTVNTHQRPGVKLMASENGGIITLHETSGQIMAAISGDANFGAITLHGTLGAPAVTLAADEQGGAAIFYDNDGKVTSSLP